MNQHERMNIRNSAGACPAFQWIGQPLTTCDACGEPYWEHTHDDLGLAVVEKRFRRKRAVISRETAIRVAKRHGAHIEVPC